MNNCIITQYKNESSRLKEWVLYHHAEGFDTFILYDDFSEDNSVQVLEELKTKYNINILIKSSDNQGSKYTAQDCLNANTYLHDNGLNFRILRSINDGLNIVRKTNPDAVCAVIDVDEFLVTNENKLVVNVIQDLMTRKDTKHIYINSYDVDDRINPLQEWCTLQEPAKYRWDFAEREAHPIWQTRGKSICQVKMMRQIPQHPGVIHHLQLGWTTIDTPEILRIHHFRVPNNCADIKLVEDLTLYNKILKIKENYDRSN